jgi:xylulokinase
MLLLGIDIGTSACKLALFDEGGKAVAIQTEGFHVYYPKPHYVEQDADAWWECVCRGMRALLEKSHTRPESVAGVGIAGQSWSAIPVDAGGRVLSRTPIWMDARARDVCEKTAARLGREHIFSVSGNPFYPSYTLPKLLHWMEHDPELIERTDKILQSNSFIAYRLTGAVSQDYSQCYGWQNFNLEKMAYDTDLTKELGIDERFLIDPVPSDAVIGRVTAEAARACGLMEGTPVTAGGLDAACGTLGAGVIGDGQTQEQGGQAGGMSICLERPIKHPSLILGAHVVPDRWLLQGGTVAGGASLDWFARTLGALDENNDLLPADGRDIFPMLSREAASVPPGSNGIIFLPYLNGERSPIWDAQAQGMLIGLGLNTAHADLVRAVMEGVAYALRHNIETAGEAGAVICEMRPMGGSANSVIWTQIKADVTGYEMVVPASDTATPAGAAMLAGVGIGMYDDYASAVARIVGIRRVQKPDEGNRAIYDKYFDIYRRLYPANREFMHALSRIKEETQ